MLIFSFLIAYLRVEQISITLYSNQQRESYTYIIILLHHDVFKSFILLIQCEKIKDFITQSKVIGKF